MGRTHNTLTYEQERKLHRNNHIGRVKGVHRWGDNRRTSNRPPVHVDSDEENESDDENPLYERILSIFKNKISDAQFVSDFSKALVDQKDEYVLADLMVSYLDKTITEENMEDVPDFGNLYDYDADEFSEYAVNYFRFINQSIMDDWIETYQTDS